MIRPVVVGPFRGLVRAPATDLPPRLLEDPAAALAGGRLLRSKKNTVVEIASPEGPGWIVRRYRPRGLHSLVRNSVMVSKERNAFTFALEYERRGVPTAPVLAILERRTKGVFRESLLVVRKVPSTTLKERLHEASGRDPDGPASGRDERDVGPEAEAWWRAFAAFVRRAHAAGVYHGDLNAANVLVRAEAERPGPDAFVLIDVNRTRFGSPFDGGRVVADLSRIGRTEAERRFFVGCYAVDAGERRRLEAAVLRRRRLHDLRKRLNRSLGIKRTLVALKLK